MLSLSENILRIISGFGILQGILLAAIIYFHKKSDRSVNTFLALYIIAASLILTIPFIIHIVGWQHSFFIQPAPFLTGPLVYLYLRSFKGRINLRKAIPHFIPFILFFFIAYYNINKFAKIYPDEKVVPAGLIRSPTTILILYLRPVHQLVYYFMARRVLLSYQRSIRHLFSETNRIELNWARLLINGYLVLACIFVLVFPFAVLFPEHVAKIMWFNFAFGAPYIYLVTFKGIMQPTIWQVQPESNKENVEVEINDVENMETELADEKTKPSRTGFNPEKIEALAAKVVDLMEHEKIYQEPELTLQQLAQKLGTSAHLLSLAINDGLKKNFYDLVNGYRVEEAKRLLLDPKSNNYTVLSIGFEAGFNSKTTFNTVFKKFTGLTPTAYKEQQAQPVL
jgi:AraC-like DNA-binding protein